MRLRPSNRPDPNLGGLFDTFTGAVSSAISTAYHTTQQSISIPLQTVSAIASGNVSQVPSLLHQAAATVPLVGNMFGGGMFGSGASLPSLPSSTPAPATATTTATLAQVTQGLTPGTPEYTAALQAAGLAPVPSGPPWGLIVGAGAGVAVLALLLRRRPAQS
jgi:hypothetical protein